jgi:catechol 2,3-dioxygenase
MSDLPAATQVGRVALDVADPDRARAFYADVVGLDPLGDGTMGAGGDPLLELRAAPDVDPRPMGAAGLFHVAYRVPGRPALADALLRLRASGRMTGASDHLASEALYGADPEDNGVEVYRDRPREQWERSPDGTPRLDTLPLDLAALEGEAAGDDGVPPGTDVGHVHLEVSDLDRARAFYVDALGFEVMDTYDGALFVGAGGYHHHVGLNVWNGSSETAGGRGLAWFELLVPDADALDAAVDRLTAAGHDVQVAGEGAAVADPDGIEVRLAVA